MCNKKFGLIGNPIGHSLSPRIFKAGYDGKYPYELIETDNFDEAYRRFIEGYYGINVTAPFKELAFAKADIYSEECRIIGATNLLVKTPDGIKAYNSDYLGVKMLLQNTLDQMNNPTVLVVGCGGAGKAAAAAAVTSGCRTILMNRNIDKSIKLSENLNAAGYTTEARPLDDFCESFKKADVIIYNIPTAIQQIDRLTEEDFAPGQVKVLLEANYKIPSFDAEFIKRMTTANPHAQYIHGKAWLLHQALTGYEIFTGEKPDLGRMSDVL
jgi:shikimate dehydrogenase